MLSERPGVCVYVTDVLLLRGGTLCGAVTGSEFTEEGGLNGMRSDRAAERRSVARA